MMKVRGKLEKTMSVKGKLEKTKSTPGKLTGSAESITEKYYKLEVDFYAALKEITVSCLCMHKHTLHTVQQQQLGHQLHYLQQCAYKPLNYTAYAYRDSKKGYSYVTLFSVPETVDSANVSNISLVSSVIDRLIFYKLGLLTVKLHL